MLGKRDLKSRQGEVRTSVIGTVGRVAHNVQFDLYETANRSQKKKYIRSASVVPTDYQNVETRTVACVLETEPAMYYKPNVPKDRKLVGNLGRQGFVWTSINGLSIELPEFVANKKDFDSFPFEVRQEFIMRNLEFRGLITTSWQEGSKLAEVTHNKFPVTKAGTAMVHPMYPTTIIAGDTVTISFPSEDDIRKKVSTPNRDDDKLLMAMKPLREVVEMHRKAIERVLDEARRLYGLYAVAVGGTDEANSINRANQLVATLNGAAAANLSGFSRYVLKVMTTPPKEVSLIAKTTTPFKILHYALQASRQDNRNADAIAMVADFNRVMATAKGHAGICEALYDRQQLLNATRLGIALTSATQGQPCDVLVGR